MAKSHASAAKARKVDWRLIALVAGAGLAIYGLYNWVPWTIPPFTTKPLDLDGASAERFDKVVDQIENLTTMLQGLAISMFVLVGLRFKDFKVGSDKIDLVAVGLVVVFFVCEFFCAYYAYQVRIGVISQLASESYGVVSIETALAYQGTALIFTAISVLAIIAQAALNPTKTRQGAAS